MNANFLSVFKNIRNILVVLAGNALYALREQDDKVYLMFLQLPEQKQERLAYDFAWEVGKTLYFQYMDAASDEYVPMCTIQEIDQVQLADGQLYDYAEGYIRGIGGKSGIFQHMMPQPTNGDQTSLLCFSRNRTLIYQNKEYAGYLTVSGQTVIYASPYNNYDTTLFFPGKAISVVPGYEEDTVRSEFSLS